VRGPVKELIEVRQNQGLSLKSEVHIGDEDLTSEELVLAEAVISPTSRLQGRTPRGVFFSLTSSHLRAVFMRDSARRRERAA